jgi:hypothetical protein
MSDREPAIFSRCDTRIPGMFGSKPFMFKRSTSERGLNEGALSAPATESVAVVWRAFRLFSSILLTPFLCDID